VCAWRRAAGHTDPVPRKRSSTANMSAALALPRSDAICIVSRLTDGPQAVGQLAGELPVSRSAVSQHLKVLKDAGLVSERAVGTRRVYRRNPTAVAALRDQLDTLLRGSATSSRRSTTCSRPRSARQSSSPTSADTSTTAPSTAANAGGHGSWLTNHQPAWYSAGTSARNGRSRPTRS